MRQIKHPKLGLGQFLNQMKISGSDKAHRSAFLLESPLDQKIVSRDLHTTEIKNFAIKPYYKQKPVEGDQEERSVPISKISINLHQNIKGKSMRERDRLVVDFQNVADLQRT